MTHTRLHLTLLLMYEAYGNHQAFNQNSLKTQTFQGRNDAGNQQVKHDFYPVVLEAYGSRMDATQAIPRVSSTSTTTAAEIHAKISKDGDPRAYSPKAR